MNRAALVLFMGAMVFTGCTAESKVTNQSPAETSVSEGRPKTLNDSAPEEPATSVKENPAAETPASDKAWEFISETRRRYVNSNSNQEGKSK